MLWGTVGEECPKESFDTIILLFFNPSALRISALSHIRAQRRSVNVFLLNCLCSCFDFSATSRDAVGYGRGGVSEGIF